MAALPICTRHNDAGASPQPAVRTFVSTPAGNKPVMPLASRTAGANAVPRLAMGSRRIEDMAGQESAQRKRARGLL